MASLKDVDNWLASSNDLACTNDARQIFTACRRREDIVFAATLLMTRGWYCVDQTYFENFMYQLHPGATVAGHRVDFLLSSRRHLERMVAIDFFDDSLEAKSKLRDDERAKAIASIIRYKRVGLSQVKNAALKVHESILADMKGFSRYSTPRYALHTDPGLVWRRLRDGFDLVGVNTRARTYRLRAWLAERRVALPPHLLPVLARCENHAEVKFLLPILLAIPWKVQRSDTSMSGTPIDRVVAGAVGVHVHFPVDSRSVSFLIGRLASRTKPPTAIVVIRERDPHERDITPILEATAAAARIKGYPYKAVAEADCDTEGRWWANLLRDVVESSTRSSKRTMPPSSNG